MYSKVVVRAVTLGMSYSVQNLQVYVTSDVRNVFLVIIPTSLEPVTKLASRAEIGSYVVLL